LKRRENLPEAPKRRPRLRPLSLLYKYFRQRHHAAMLVDTLIELIISMIRTLLIEELVERIRKLRPERHLHGMSAVRRHVLHTNRQRLLNRLSTEVQ
jgi:hypothetical protein